MRINRDPIEEEGGYNLYAFCEGDPINDYDILGLRRPRGNPGNRSIAENLAFTRNVFNFERGRLFEEIERIKDTTVRDNLRSRANAIPNSVITAQGEQGEVSRAEFYNRQLQRIRDLQREATGENVSANARRNNCICPPLDPQQYSVAIEVRLSPESYPGVSRPEHFREANEELLRRMERDPEFSRLIKKLGINIQRGPKGGVPDEAPSGWTWHHGKEPGQLHLVPRVQHKPGSEFQDIFHPGGVGGFSIWGKE